MKEKNMYRLIRIIVAVLVLVTSVIVTSAQDPPPTTVPGDDVAEDIVDFTVETAEGAASSLDDFLDRLITTPKSDIARVLLVVGGVILLVAGWRVYDLIIVIAGFVIGASVAVSLVTSENTLIVVGALLLGGLIGAFLSVFVYHIAVFLIGAYVGIVLTNALAAALDVTPISALILFIGGIIGGIVLLGLSFEFLVVLSSLVGAQMLSLGLNLDVMWTLIFAIIGVVVQLGLMRTLNYSFRRRSRRVRLFPRLT
jgi:hypothetical protein